MSDMNKVMLDFRAAMIKGNPSAAIRIAIGRLDDISDTQIGRQHAGLFVDAAMKCPRVTESDRDRIVVAIAGSYLQHFNA